VALDAATQNFLIQAASAGGKPPWEVPVEEARGAGAAFAAMQGKGPEVQSVGEHRLEIEGGTFSLRTYRPFGQPTAVLVYFHGGGWVLGDISEQDVLARNLTVETGSTVVMVNYRKAPENPFPAAANDAWAALLWAAERKEELTGRSDAPLVVAGDSAGGNLAIITTHRAREAQSPKIDLQVLVYPVTDADFERPSYMAPENQLMLSKPMMEWFWDQYVPNPEQRRHPEASPLRAADLSGLPPAVVFVAEHDVLRDEVEAYARGLRDAGVPAEEILVEGQMHGFISMINILPASNETVRAIGNQLQGRFAAAEA
jgi:acetyl esterase